MVSTMPLDQESSFLAEVNPNIGIVHRICRAYFPRDAAEREDVFQDIMFQLWKSYLQFKGEAKFSTWMHKVALNTAITHIRRSTRMPLNTELSESLAHAFDMSAHMDREEELQQLYEAIGTLSAIDKAIVLLHLEEQSYEDIATVTGLTKANVSVRLVRIKRALKVSVQETK
jgi:RNA polymerase sigma factor (sigma-70 family)